MGGLSAAGGSSSCRGARSIPSGIGGLPAGAPRPERCASPLLSPLPSAPPAGLQEHSTLEPTNPYSAAKAGAEMMCKAYLTSYKLPIIITRGNNVYGPHQFPEKMIPKFTLLAARGSELPVHGALAGGWQPEQ